MEPPESEHREHVLLTIAFIQYASRQLGKLPRGQFQDERVTVSELWKDVHQSAQDAGILDPDTSLDDVFLQADEDFQIIAHPTESHTTIDGNPKEKFANDMVCKLTYKTHHAPDYVMQLDNGFFVKMVAPVEATAGTRRPTGVSEERLHELIEDEHVQVNWLPKKDSPFGRRRQ